MSRSRGSSLLYAAPFLLGVVWLLGPVIVGSDTLFLRDALNTHLPMKWFQAEAMSSGWLPLVDPYRSGGQPHLGNPNTVPLYPDNLLYLFAPTVWAFNAHFWLHLLLAPLAFAYLARQWGLAREAAWASGVIYATSGYYLSTLNLYNLTAGTTLTPAFIGACLAVVGRDARGRTLAAGSLLWTLLLLGGDPMTAAVALAAAVSAVGIARGWRAAGWGKIAWIVAVGSLVAAPQVVEFLRILPASYRGVQGYTVAAATAASWSPANLLEWFVPMAFGEPSLLYWGERFHAGRLPLFYSLYPGLVALAAMTVGLSWRERRSRWIWLMIGVGLFLSMGSYNPVAEWMLGLPGMQILRLPVKLWILVAIGLALLAGCGLGRILEEGGVASLRRALWVLCTGTAVAAVGLWLARDSAATLLAAWMPPRIPADFAAQEVGRWSVALGVSAVLLGLAAVLGSLSGLPRRGLVGGLLALHVVGQVWLLGAMVPTDPIAVYRQENPLVARIPDGARVVHGDAGGLFGPETVRLEQYPDADLRWLQRDTFARLYPAAGVLAGRRFEFWPSPEGLDSFLTRAVAQALPLVDDPLRLDLLEASGITHLLLGRPLEGVEPGRARLLAQHQVSSGTVHLYRLTASPGEVLLAGRVLRANDPRRAVARLTDPTFDPRRAVVLVGEGGESFGDGGGVEVIERSDEHLVVRVRSEGPGAVVIQRSYLPIYSAELDGRPVEVLVANMHRMAVEVPDGEHDLRLWADRRAVWPSFLVALLGLALLALKVRRLSPPSGGSLG